VIIAEVTLDDTDQSGITALGLTVGPKAAWPVPPPPSPTLRAGAAAARSRAPASPVGRHQRHRQPHFLQRRLQPDLQRREEPGEDPVGPRHRHGHNKQAEVNVGEQVRSSPAPVHPVSGGSTVSSGFATNSTVSYQTIAIDLKVTPLIGENGDVQMTVDQKVDDIISETTIDQNQQPIIGHREATSF